MKQKEEPRLTLPRPLTTTTTAINLDVTADTRHATTIAVLFTWPVLTAAVAVIAQTVSLLLLLGGGA